MGVGFLGAYLGCRKSFVLEKKSVENTFSLNVFCEGVSYKAKDDNRVHPLYFLSGWRHFGPW